jgi:hypothetical protein
MRGMSGQAGRHSSGCLPRFPLTPHALPLAPLEGQAHPGLVAVSHDTDRNGGVIGGSAGNLVQHR